ncbi:Phenazine biosynthesis PhzC/PhzF protein [Mycena indigotica]|uniref:Phenazine biosynthesis PhzC/PhzF protein n=1 Tax=Mycena indigotica TaxID=2126181 RepID=A0A8H6ST22_9AGAR|nr:Phenazine biosynthesis PhzC/PhzF protein [Mycena indigotica]KAF7303852.1 Phenazine biosynthesis PhzC/PhzF protein [Mycena indigotica]
MLRFIQLDVFTSTPFIGNPLAIVLVPAKSSLSQEQKQLIAREFNLSETVFLHELEENTTESTFTIDIFTTTEELPFAGHPTVGSGFYLLSRWPHLEQITLHTRAGDIPVVRAPGGGVRLNAPIDFKVHPRLSISSVKELQPRLCDSDYLNGMSGSEGCASVVKGMTFLLLALSSEEALAQLQPYPTRLEIPAAERTSLGEWGVGFAGIYAFYEVPSNDGLISIRTRMFDGPLEDPATGSAACTLAGWLASQKGPGLHEFKIIQGVEMGRRSDITVAVDVDDMQRIKSIALEGEAVEVMEGAVHV